MEKIWCPICGKIIDEKEYRNDLKNLINTPDNACENCRKNRGNE